MRPVGGFTVVAGQGLVTQTCSSYVACVVPNTTNGSILGIAMQGGTNGALIPVCQMGTCYALFSNTGTVGDQAIVNASGGFTDTTIATGNIPGNVGRAGSILATTNADGSANSAYCGTLSGFPNCYFVNNIGPGTTGTKALCIGLYNQF